MDFKNQLRAEFSRRNTDYVVSFIDGDIERFAHIWEIMVSGEPPLPQRASWVVSVCFVHWPNLLRPYLIEMVNFIPKAAHPGIKRSLLRILSFSEIPEPVAGELLNLCFEYLEMDLPVAVKVHAMQILYNISEKVPDIKPELIAIIEEQMAKNSIGFKTRGRKLLKKLYQKSQK